METRTRLGSAIILCWALLSLAPGARSESTSPTQRRYVPLETEDAYVYMDEEGVAVRAEKNWACRNVGWASTADPKIFSSPDFARFRQGQINGGTWDQWLCRAVIGPVVFSREILEAQRKMNMAPDKPDCVSWVPETGRLNWEALDYARCYVSKEVVRARAAYRDRFSEALAKALDGRTAPLHELIVAAKAAKLPFTVKGCGRWLETAFEVAACRMEVQDRLLTEAEGFLANYAERVDARRGIDSLSPSDAAGLAEDAELIRSRLRDAQGEADGL